MLQADQKKITNAMECNVNALLPRILILQHRK